MQVQRAPYFGSHHTLQSFRTLVREDPIVEHAGRMHNAG